jgi:hypothetical protein
MDEELIWKDVEGSGHGLIEASITLASSAAIVSQTFISLKVVYVLLYFLWIVISSVLDFSTSL